MAALRTEAPKRAVPPSGRRERVACCPGGFSAGPRGGLALLGTFPGCAFLSLSFLSLTVAPRSSSCAVKRGHWPADPCARQRPPPHPPHRSRPPGVAPQHGEGPERKQVSGQGRSLLWGPPTPCGRKRPPSSTGPRARGRWAHAGNAQRSPWSSSEISNMSQLPEKKRKGSQEQMRRLGWVARVRVGLKESSEQLPSRFGEKPTKNTSQRKSRSVPRKERTRDK